jgi:hypothetical protein
MNLITKILRKKQQRNQQIQLENEAVMRGHLVNWILNEDHKK